MRNSPLPDSAPLPDLLPQLDRAAAHLTAASSALEAVVIGQRTVIERVLITLLSGGHGLMIGLPGLAKTRLVKALGVVLGLETRRVQFTPDLMPADILGAEVLETLGDGSRRFRFIKGPIFCQLLLADEINRASPRTQSALLEAMQEGQVTIAGEQHRLPQPFHVLATQNPIEQEGTYPLPEAQLDRFALHIPIDYPDRASERALLLATTGTHDITPQPVMTADDLSAAQQVVRAMPIPANVLEAVLNAARHLRPGPDHPDIAWGPGPRGAQALLLAARARALLHGRAAPLLDDVAALIDPAFRHRLALTLTGRRQGKTLDSLLEEARAIVLA